MLKNNEKIKKAIVIILIAIMSGVIFFYQKQKVGLVILYAHQLIQTMV